MDPIECIKTRRSRRAFLPKPIPEETLATLMDCAIHAPFGGPPIKGPQLREFIIVKDQKTKQALALGYDDRQFLATAPVVIAICADTPRDKGYRDWATTCALASQNIMLAAHASGLGACYLTAFTHHAEHREDKRKLIAALMLPEHIELVGFIALGYPDPKEEIKEKELRTADEITHNGKW